VARECSAPATNSAVLVSRDANLGVPEPHGSDSQYLMKIVTDPRRTGLFTYATTCLEAWDDV